MADRDAPPKYAPLAAYLTELAPTTMSVTLTLAEIERLIGDALPAAAWARSWWQIRQERGQPRPWRVAGWHVSGVSMRVAPSSVTFARVAADATTQPRAALP